MRQKVPQKLEKGRITTGDMGTQAEDGFFGAFQVHGPCGMSLRIISSESLPGWEWEHVSVSLPNRCPNWIEMCFIKDLFWGEDEVVMQLHPAKKDYVNFHQYCLHLWKPTLAVIPTPPKIMVGPDTN